MTLAHDFHSWRPAREGVLSARIRSTRRTQTLVPDLTPPMPDEQGERSSESEAFTLGMRRLLEVVRDGLRGRFGLVPLSDEVIHAAKETLREIAPATPALAPTLVASHRGDLQLEWSLPHALVEVHITPNGERYVSVEGVDGESVFDGDYLGGLTYVRKELDRAHHGG